MAREPYRHAELRRLVDPGRIAIIGASDTPGSLGALTAENCTCFAGEVLLVNPQREVIGGRPCYRSVLELPAVPDCAVLAVPRAGVEAVVTQCAEAGVGAAIIYAAGFAEVADPEWRAAQPRLAAIAREAGMRILGPNTAGLANHVAGLGLTFTPGYAFFHHDGPSVGIVSQSGGLCNGLVQAGHLGVSISHALSTGNACDVDVADLVAFLAEAPECAAIALTFEGLDDPIRLRAAGRIAWERNKPLIVFKAARGAYGAAAAASHSGMLAGEPAAWDALFDEIGAVQVHGLEALVETAAFFAKAGEPRGRGLAVIANSGGAAILAGDAAGAHGVTMPQPAEATQRAIAAVLPDFGAARNPLDLTAQVAANEPMLRACGEALFADPAYGVVAWPYLYARESVQSRRRTLSELAAAHGKILIVAWLSNWLEGPGRIEAEHDPHTAVFHAMDRAAATVAAWIARADARGRPRASGRLSPAEAPERARALLRSASGSTLTETAAKAILALYGIPTARERLAGTAREAAEAAEMLGYPVALKLASSDIAHKSDAGGVRLNLGSRPEVANAFAEVLAAARVHAPRARIEGVVVQPMVPAGTEIMVGGRIDPLFGPLVVVALGGIFVEVLADSATALAPVGPEGALRLLSRLRGQAVLDGVRGRPPVDRQALAGIIARFSELLADLAPEIVEADVNPLICHGADIVAVDGLIVPRAEGEHDGPR